MSRRTVEGAVTSGVGRPGTLPGRGRPRVVATGRPSLCVLLCLTLCLAAGPVSGGGPSAQAAIPEVGDATSPVAASPPPWGGTGRTQPVLLVSSPGTDPEEAWGGEGGLRRKLEEAGYRVWVADLSREDDPDPERLARLVVGPAAGRVLAACGADRLHIVAHGAGALAARYWAEWEGAERVANLVMLGPPNHGSFAINLLHLAAALSAREAGLVGAASGQGDSAASGQGGSAAGAGGESADGNLWAYVWEKAASVYQPLYRRYVREYRLGVPPPDVLEGVKRLLGRLPFEGWLAGAEPELFTRDFRQAQEPLPGGSVTRAYAHAAALNVARVEELRRAIRGPGLVDSVLQDPLITSDWKEMARHYGGKVLLWAGRQVADWLTRQGQKVLVDQAPALLGVDPYSPGAGRLLQEYFSLPLGPGADGRPRYEQFLGNWFLNRWNQATSWREAADRDGGEGPTAAAGDEGELRRDVGSRYVVISGRVPNLWRLGWKQVGDNDFWVEVDSCFLALGPDDRFVVIEDRGVSASHGWLPRNRRLQELVLRELGFAAQRSLYPRAGHPGTVAWKGTRQLPLACWQPGYLRLDSRYLTRPGDLMVELQPRAPTHRGLPVAWVWVQRRDGTWEHRYADWEGDRGTISVPLFGYEVTSVLVGSRLPLPDDRNVMVAYRKAPQGEMTCRASFFPEATSGGVPASPEDGAGGAHVPGHDRGGAAVDPGLGGDVPSVGGSAVAGSPGHGGGTVGGVASQGAPPGQDREDSPPSGAALAETGLPPNVPVIRATLRTKLTTHKKEQRVRHLRWDWDFGDGTTFVDEDPTHTTVTVSHVFERPGNYSVRAVSYATDGRVLRDRVWKVTVVEPPAPAAPGAAEGSSPGLPETGETRPQGEGTVVVGETWQAAVDTAREPRVTATLDMPREWMSGRPARIRVSAAVEEVPYLVEQRVEIDPGEEFIMIWERAGLFPVRVAVTVSLRYRFPEAEYTLRNTYLFERWVKVLTTSGTD